MAQAVDVSRNRDFAPHKYRLGIGNFLMRDPRAPELEEMIANWQNAVPANITYPWRPQTGVAVTGIRPPVTDVSPPYAYFRRNGTAAKDIVWTLGAGDYGFDCKELTELSLYNALKCLAGYSKVLNVAAVPVEVTPADKKTPRFTVPVYLVEVERDGKIKVVIVDHENIAYASVKEWEETNGLPSGRMKYPKDLGIGARPGEQELVTSNTPESDPEVHKKYLNEYWHRYESAQATAAEIKEGKLGAVPL
jgi:hypothetical protein